MLKATLAQSLKPLITLSQVRFLLLPINLWYTYHVTSQRLELFQKVIFENWLNILNHLTSFIAMISNL